jgi:DNA-binding transcriptional LysR family regulator
LHNNETRSTLFEFLIARALGAIDGNGRSMTINLTQLATFVQLAERRNFTRTADALHLTQPAVTQQIRALERDLGVTLVDIVARRTEITEIGALVAERGELLLDQVDALRRDVRELAEARTGVVHVGATVTIGGYVLPGLLARFAARHPGIRVDVAVENTATIVPMVADGRVGLALVEGVVADDALDVVPFADDELVLIVGDAHRFADRRSVAPTDLADEPFVTREVGSGTRELF